jgi:hypothetical protein
MPSFSILEGPWPMCLPNELTKRAYLIYEHPLVPHQVGHRGGEQKCSKREWLSIP